MSRERGRWRGCTCGCCLSMLLGFHQSTLAAADEASAVPESLEEVVVTSRRRAESLQDVPLAVTVLTERAIRDAGVERVADFVKFVPNVSYDNSLNLGTNFLTIRGIGQSQFAPPPAAIVVDGVLTISPLQFNVEEFDLQQIEVLKGPQGGLYGRNAIAGAINITTRKPGDEFAARMLLGYGEGNEYQARTSVSGPLVEDKLFLGVAGSFRDRDGQIRNITTGNYIDHYRDLTGRLRLIARPASGVELDVKYSYSDTEGRDPTYILNPSADPDEHSLPVQSNAVGANPRKMHDLSARLDMEAGTGTASLILAYVDADETVISDYDFLADDIFRVQQDQRERGFSQELRFASSREGSLRWLIGAYHVRSERQLGQRGLADPGFFVDPPAPTGVADFLFLDNSDVNTFENFSGFGQFELDLSAAFELALALRYDDDSNEQRSSSGARREASFREWQPKATLTYKPATDFVFYSSYGKGFRSGDINPSGAAIGLPVARAESAVTYELGLKSQWLGRRLIVNSALFHTDLEDGQFKVLDFTTGSNVGINVDEIRIQGLEIEAAARLGSRLSINAAAGLTDAEVRKFALDPTTVGNAPPRVPDYTFNVGFSYEQPVGERLSLFLRPDYRRLGPWDWTLDGAYPRGAVDYLDVRFGVRSADDRWSVTARVNNALDERTTPAYEPFSQTGQPFGLDVYFPTAGTAWGIEFAYQL